MSDQPSKKNVAITIVRERTFMPKTVVTTGFKLRIEKTSGLIEVLLETSGQSRGEKVALDPVILLNNSDNLKRFAASAGVDADDSVLREEILVSEQTSFSNIVHFSQMGLRGETIFGVFSLSDWVSESRQATRTTGEVKSYDVVVSSSTAALQKKLVLELILLINQLSKSR
jgi:hypothetical protein